MKIYADNAATTKMSERAIEAMLPHKCCSVLTVDGIAAKDQSPEVRKGEDPPEPPRKSNSLSMFFCHEEDSCMHKDNMDLPYPCLDGQ